MAFTLPNPTSPTNGQSLDATPILANEIALAQAIASFDGSQIQSGTTAGSALVATANPNTLLNATSFPFVASGCVWSVVSGLGGTMSGGTIYYGGTPVTVNSVASHTFTASKDTYVDVDRNGNVTYQPVTNNSASPSITANSIRVGIVITGASAITFVNIGQIDTTISGFAPIISSVSLTTTDSLGNLIYPTDPQMRILGYRQITAAVTGITSTSGALVTGLTCPVSPPSGRKVKVSVWSRGVYMSTGVAQGQLQIWSGTVGSGTNLSQADSNPAGTSQPNNIEAKAVTLPGTTPITYNAGAATGNGSDAVNVDAATVAPAYILVELE